MLSLGENLTLLYYSIIRSNQCKEPKCSIDLDLYLLLLPLTYYS